MDGLDQSPLWGVIGVLIGMICYIFLKKKTKKNINLVFYILFFYYIFRALSFTLLPLPLSDISKEIYLKLNKDMTNFIPFKELFSNLNISVIKQYILNIILFIPFGVLFPLITKNKISNSKTMILSFISSLLIELTQLSISIFWIGAGFRVCDINDLLLNTLGGIIGLCAVTIFLSVLKNINKSIYLRFKND